MPQHTPEERRLAVRRRLKRAGLEGKKLERAATLGASGFRKTGVTRVGPEGFEFRSPEEKAEFEERVRRQSVRGGSKFHGSVGDKAPAGVTNHADRMRKDVVEAVRSDLRQTFTTQILSERGSRPGGSKGEAPMIPNPNAMRVTSDG